MLSLVHLAGVGKRKHYSNLHFLCQSILRVLGLQAPEKRVDFDSEPCGLRMVPWRFMRHFCRRWDVWLEQRQRMMWFTMMVRSREIMEQIATCLIETSR